MQMIVSRNYRDRSVAARRRSLLEVLEGKPKITGSVASRWLMRGSEQLIRDASPLDHIVATDVKFVDAPKGEDGFGCRVVALCNEAQCLDTPPDAKEAGEIRLKFDMLYGEFYAPDRRVVTGCKRLRLLPDASILALEPIYRETAKSVAA